MKWICKEEKRIYILINGKQLPRSPMWILAQPNISDFYYLAECYFKPCPINIGKEQKKMRIRGIEIQIKRENIWRRWRDKTEKNIKLKNRL